MLNGELRVQLNGSMDSVEWNLLNVHTAGSTVQAFVAHFGLCCLINTGIAQMKSA